MIETILNALGTINNLSEQDKFEKKDLVEMRKASFKLHEVVTKLIYKVGKLETENSIFSEANNYGRRDNYMLNSETASNLQDNNMEKSKKVLPKTYSTIVQIKDRKQEEIRKESWKTPKKSRKHEILIKSKNPSEIVNIVKEVKKKINEMGNNETLKSIRHLQSGAVILECHNEEQQKRLQEIIKKQENLQAKDLQNTDPMIMITGIEKGYEPEIIIREFINDNPRITTEFGQNVDENIKFVTKKRCRNDRKENWIFQTPPKLFKWLIRNDSLCFDLTKAYIQEYVNMVMCSSIF